MFWSMLQKSFDQLKFECDICIPEEISFKSTLILSKKKKLLFEVENKTLSTFFLPLLSQW